MKSMVIIMGTKHMGVLPGVTYYYCFCMQGEGEILQISKHTESFVFV